MEPAGASNCMYTRLTADGVGLMMSLSDAAPSFEVTATPTKRSISDEVPIADATAVVEKKRKRGKRDFCFTLFNRSHSFIEHSYKCW
jgi:hypothetical protein